LSHFATQSFATSRQIRKNLRGTHFAGVVARRTRL
jgi:hypothetical protein